MTCIPSEVRKYKLNIDSLNTLVIQKKRKQGPFQNQIIEEEVNNLLKIGSIRE